jgi:hypothetical protein
VGLGVGLAQSRLAGPLVGGGRRWVTATALGAAAPFLGFDLADAVGLEVEWSLGAATVLGGGLVGVAQARLLRRGRARRGDRPRLAPGRARLSGDQQEVRDHRGRGLAALRQLERRWGRPPRRPQRSIRDSPPRRHTERVPEPWLPAVCTVPARTLRASEAERLPCDRAGRVKVDHGGRMFPFATPAEAAPGEVTLPLAEWKALQPGPATPAPAEALPVERTVEGRVDRGVFVGVVRTTVQVECGPVRVPVVPDGASMVRGAVDGRDAAFASDGTWQSVDLPPGRHEVEVALVLGRDTDRFARELALALPPGPPTTLRVEVPEAPIDATLTGGVLGPERVQGGSTALVGWLDATGSFELQWERRPEHRVLPGQASTSTRVDAVVQVDRDVVVGTARYAVDVRSGAIDQVALKVPPGSRSST